jgi:hypothetical protein
MSAIILRQFDEISRNDSGGGNGGIFVVMRA